VVVSRVWWEAGSRSLTDVLVVPDTLAALQQLARAHRERHPVPLVGVTGSNGKTTTKDLVAAALIPLGSVLKTSGNLNNHIGLPLTLLELDAHHQAAVVEIGLNHPGELRELAALAGPRVGIITSVAEAHLEGLGSIQGVASAKAELAEALPEDGVLVYPQGSEPLREALAWYQGGRITFGLTPEADFHPVECISRGFDGMTIVLPDGVRVEIALTGDHAVLNTLAALAAAGAMGVSPAEAAPHLAEVPPPAGRLCPRNFGGITVLDDTYNANPASLAASLGVLEAGEAAHRFAILGDMLELGEDGARLHREAGKCAGFLDGLITVGDLGREIGRGAVEAGLDAGRVQEAASGESAAAMLLPELGKGDVVLVKGSRGMRLETAVAQLLAGLGGEG
jgi:UDP-N-acetylmuramoyl-tripeptide--D-alanyl-D-alanine ligase